MNLEYETDRLILKILKPSAEFTKATLQFYYDNRTFFEPYEPLRPDNFYTEKYQKSLLTCEYNLAVRMNTVRFWVFEKTDPRRIIGTICFHNITRSVYDRCETGYKFDYHYWHKGYAAEAMRQGLSIMFDDVGLHRIEAFVMPKNTSSLRLLSTLGFQYEGTLRQAVKICGKWEDHLLFSRLK